MKGVEAVVWANGSHFLCQLVHKRKPMSRQGSTKQALALAEIDCRISVSWRSRLETKVHIWHGTVVARKDATHLTVVYDCLPDEQRIFPPDNTRYVVVGASVKVDKVKRKRPRSESVADFCGHHFKTFDMTSFSWIDVPHDRAEQIVRAFSAWCRNGKGITDIQLACGAVVNFGRMRLNGASLRCEDLD
jgi:hypothetical protein